MQLEGAIERIESLYTQITGQEAPKSAKQPYAPILPERDPGKQVEANLERLLMLLQQTPLPMLARAQWVPPTTVLETENEILVKCDLPGVLKEEVQVKIESGRLVVRGTRTDKESGMHVTARIVETPTGRFERFVEIPPSLFDAKCQHQLVDGVLTVTLPKKKAKTPDTK